VIEEDKRRIRARHNANDFLELALADEAKRIGLLTPLDEGGGDRRTG
jgi:hypothetical protein